MAEAGSLWLPKSAIKTRLHIKAVGSVIFRSIIASALPYITISRRFLCYPRLSMSWPGPVLSKASQLIICLRKLLSFIQPSKVDLFPMLQL